MPPFVSTICLNCSKSNHFDLAELCKEGGLLVKGFAFRGEEKGEEEFEITCQHCGKKFKLTVKGGSDDKIK